MKKYVNESLNDATEQNGAFADDDGWDKDALEEVGLIEWLNNAQRLAYEVNNCVRGSYACSGNTAEDLIQYLHELQDELTDIIDIMHESI